MTARVLIAGVGNIFLGDDGFGVEVASRLARQTLPDHVRVEDFGIRGVHLAYELLEDYELAILVDAVSRGGAPGDLYVIEPETSQDTSGSADPLLDAHGMEPRAVLALLETLGGCARVLVVGCEPADTTERMGLSEPVEAAVDRAIPLIMRLLEHEMRVGSVSATGVGSLDNGKEGS